MTRIRIRTNPRFKPDPTVKENQIRIRPSKTAQIRIRPHKIYCLLHTQSPTLTLNLTLTLELYLRVSSNAPGSDTRLAERDHWVAYPVLDPDPDLDIDPDPGAIPESEQR